MSTTSAVSSNGLQLIKEELGQIIETKVTPARCVCDTYETEPLTINQPIVDNQGRFVIDPHDGSRITEKITVGWIPNCTTSHWEAGLVERQQWFSRSYRIADPKLYAQSEGFVWGGLAGFFSVLGSGLVSGAFVFGVAKQLIPKWDNLALGLGLSAFFAVGIYVGLYVGKRRYQANYDKALQRARTNPVLGPYWSLKTLPPRPLTVQLPQDPTPLPCFPKMY